MPKNIKQTKNFLLLLVTILLALSIAANIYLYYVGVETTSDDNFEEQIESLTNELNQLNTTYNQYKADHTFSNTEYESLNNTYNIYSAAHTVTDEDYGDLQNQYDALSAIYESYALDHVYSNSEYNALENQIETLETQIEARDEEIEGLQTEIDSIRVSIEIEEVVWDTAADTATVTIRNTGGVNIDVVAIILREDTPESTWYADYTPDATGLINSGETEDFVWDGAETGFDLLDGTSYVIQVEYVSKHTAEY